MKAYELFKIAVKARAQKDAEFKRTMDEDLEKVKNSDGLKKLLKRIEEIAKEGQVQARISSADHREIMGITTPGDNTYLTIAALKNLGFGAFFDSTRDQLTVHWQFSEDCI